MNPAEPLCTLVTAGHQVRPGADYRFDCRRKPPPRRALLQLTLAGSAFHQRGGRRTLVGPGQAILDILPGDWSYGHAEGRYELVFATIAGEPALPLAERIIAGAGNVLDLGTDAPLVAPLMALARQFTRHEAVDRWRTSARIYEVLMLVQSRLGQRRIAACPVTAEALRLIHERWADPGLGVAEIAAAIGCSRSHLARRFLAATGTTPLDHLIQHRLDLARRAVRSGEGRIGEIARRHGFAGANYFCRLFRQRFGMTPLRYRGSAG